MFDRTLVIDRCTIQLITWGTISWTSRVPKDQKDLKLPSGKQTYWKWPWKKWMFPLKMVIFHGYVNVYQRVMFTMKSQDLGVLPCISPFETSKMFPWTKVMSRPEKIKCLGRDHLGAFWDGYKKLGPWLWHPFFGAVTWEILGHF